MGSRVVNYTLDKTTFSSVGLIRPLIEATSALSYQTPTAVQAQAIPYLLKGRDILGLSNTGTGKTAAFLLPILQQLSLNNYASPPKGCCSLILVPTRELASQVHNSVGKYGQFMDSISCRCVVGGVSRNPQVCSIRNGTHILVATPGRLLDLVREGHITLKGVRFFVLDEFDKMLEMGFLCDIRKVLSYIPKNRQTLLFSATMPDGMMGLANEILKDPLWVETGSKTSPAEGINHEVFHICKPDKRSLLCELLEDIRINRALVFTRTKYTAFKVEKYLKRARIPTDSIHSRKSQKARNMALARFKAERIRVLVATDVASRGLDVKNISHVINYDLPELPENYIHRVGRTARAGDSGVALSLCDPCELPLLKKIESLIGFKIKVCEKHPFQIQSAPAILEGDRQQPRK